MMFLKQTSSVLLLIIAFVSVYALPASKPSFLVETIVVRDTVPPSDTGIFEKVEEEAYFAGGEASWRSYLEQNLNPMVPVERGAKPGIYTVYIQFVVDIDGKISAIKPLTKHGFGMETEVMRILRKSPNWVPAVQGGKKVRAYRKQPVTFQIEEEKKRRRGKG